VVRSRVWVSSYGFRIPSLDLSYPFLMNDEAKRSNYAIQT
jgi:hypothetical protein